MELNRDYSRHQSTIRKLRCFFVLSSFLMSIVVFEAIYLAMSGFAMNWNCSKIYKNKKNTQILENSYGIMSSLFNNMHHDKKEELSRWYIEIFIFRGNKCILSSTFIDFRGFTFLKVTDIGKVCVNHIFFNEMKFKFKFFNL